MTVPVQAIPINVLPHFPGAEPAAAGIAAEPHAGRLAAPHPAPARQWMVKDLAFHLLDGNLRTLSMLRDDYAGEAPSDVSYAGIVANLNRLNAD